MLYTNNNSLCNLSSIKIQMLIILKKGLLTELERKKKILRKAILFLGRACFVWEGRSMANRHF